MKDKISKSDKEWQAMLTPGEYHITRQKGTERAFTGEYWQATGKEGRYLCRCCGEELFESAAKFDSGCGWPSFFQPMKDEKVEEFSDVTLGMRRIEVTCARCDAHLGHVFPDGPNPTGLRYCINSASIRFDEKNSQES